MGKKVIAVDFDGVLFRPREPDADPLIIVGEIRDGGLDFLRDLALTDDVSVVLVSDRVTRDGIHPYLAGYNAMFKALERAAEIAWPGEEQPWLRSIDYAAGVPGNALAILSSRAVSFDGDFGTDLLRDLLDGPGPLEWPEIPGADPFALGPMGDNGSERSPIMGTLRMAEDTERAAGAPDQPNAGAPPVEQMRASDGSGGTGGTGVVANAGQADPFSLDDVNDRKDATDGTANLSAGFSLSDGDPERAAGGTNGPTAAAAPTVPPEPGKAKPKKARKPKAEPLAPVPDPAKRQKKPTSKGTGKKPPAKKSQAKRAAPKK